MSHINNNLGDWCSQVHLNDVPQYSAWPSKIIGVKSWKPPSKRNAQKIQQEYGEKWGKLVAAMKDTRNLGSLEECINYLFRIHFSRNTMLFNLGENIYYTKDMASFWNFTYKKIFGVINQYLNPSDLLVELGCGWGRNLFWAMKEKVCKRCIGGEFTEEGVTLGRQISQIFNINAEFYHFDFLEPSSSFLKKLRGAVVFTSQSIEQISYLSTDVILSIAEQQPKAVIQFEPIYEYLNKDTLLHIFWRRYTELNRYNQNLLTILKSLENDGRIKIISEDIHVFGLNAFNPCSIVTWVPL